MEEISQKLEILQWKTIYQLVSFIDMILYFQHKVNGLTVIFVCFKGLLFKLWNSICFRQCRIHNYKCYNVNISNRNSTNDFQVTYAPEITRLTLEK